MIQISLTTALVFYSALLGFLVLVIWTYTEISVRRSHRILEQQFLWRCVFCGYIYLDEAAEDLSQCPRCRSYNSITDRHARYVETPVAWTEPAPAHAAGSDDLPRNTSHRKRPHQRRRGPRKR